jgi:hypothetical protein
MIYGSSSKTTPSVKYNIQLLGVSSTGSFLLPGNNSVIKSISTIEGSHSEALTLIEVNAIPWS